MDRRVRIALSAVAVAAIISAVALPAYVLPVLLVIIGGRGGGNWFVVAGVFGCAVPPALTWLTIRARRGSRAPDLVAVEAALVLAAASWLVWLVLMLLA